jgi:hypothetical protein
VEAKWSQSGGRMRKVVKFVGRYRGVPLGVDRDGLHMMITKKNAAMLYVRTKNQLLEFESKSFR